MPPQFSKRLFAYIIDIFIVLLVTNILTIFIPINEKTQAYYKEMEVIQEKFYNQEIDTKEYITLTLEDNYNISKDTVLISLISIIVYIVYFGVYQVYNNGQTVGKKLMKIKLKAIDNGKLSINKVLSRTLIIYGIATNLTNIVLLLFIKKDLYLLISSMINALQSFIVIISVIMILFSSKKRGIHDIITKTEVIMEEK